MQRRDDSSERRCSPDAYLVAVRTAICGSADTVVVRRPRLRVDAALRRSFGERVEVVHEQGDHGMPGMLRLEFDVNVTVLRHRPDALGVVRLERLSIAEELANQVMARRRSLTATPANRSTSISPPPQRADLESQVNSLSSFPGERIRPPPLPQTDPALVTLRVTIRYG